MTSNYTSNETVNHRVKSWLEGNYDAETKKVVKHMIENDQNELIESFYTTLEFGTGGLRGIMGVGTNRMNIYTVGMATQGLANYVKKNFDNLPQIKVAIAYDCRNNSRLFAETTAKIFAANGFYVYLFDSLRPTPELSFAVRHFGCQTGVVITASHNPKEYNGYKAYWDDGGQVIEPHDKNIIDEVNKITLVDEVKWSGNEKNIQLIGADFDALYLDRLLELSLSPDAITRQKNMKIVYTPLHGTGVILVPAILKKMGFENIITVPEQEVNDGNFPTLHSPNPEESAALNMAIEKARQTGASLVMATDPDADRVGIAVLNKEGKYELLNGNQTGSILLYYLLTKWKEKGKLKGREYIVKTIVTTELLVDMAKKFGVEYYDVLTGFKYIADVLRKNEGKKSFIGGGEESYGYLAGEFVRDKDAVMACALIAEAAAWAADQGKTVLDLLDAIYLEFGLYKEALTSLVRKGKSGVEEIQKIMDDYRKNRPVKIGNSKIVLVKDYLLKKETDIISGTEKSIDLPKSNVLQFFTEDGSKITVRPSGTEPKIKFYIGVKQAVESNNLPKANEVLDKRIAGIKQGLGI